MLTVLKRGGWGEDAAAHLLNRAGFGGTPEEVATLARLSPEEAVTSLVEFGRVDDAVTPPSWVGPESDRRGGYKQIRELPEAERKVRMDALRAEQTAQMQELRGWWVARMLASPRPLQEKLTLFWHGHFATSVRKVRSGYAMYRQNDTFRKHAAGNWRALLTEAAQEPAMLVYLDNAQSRAAAPNENFARELMELFTLGEGHYTEQDIREGARALTGWSLSRERFVFEFRPRMHDDGEKTFLGKRGRLDGNDVIAAILEQPQAAEFIAKKFWEFFAYRDPDPVLVKELASVLRRHQYEFKPMLTAMFSSAEFYSARALRTQVKSPVQWLVGAVKACGVEVPPAGQVNRILRRLGQDLFAPPNVKGWDGGIAWINAASLTARYNFAALVVNGGGPLHEKSEGLEGARVLPEARRQDLKTALDYLRWRFFMGVLRVEDERAIAAGVEGFGAPKEWKNRQVREVAALMMRTAQYQVT